MILEYDCNDNALIFYNYSLTKENIPKDES